MKHHCVVTPDIIGPINNGGIGTACYHLVGYLRSLGDEVDILFTGPCEIQTNAHWAAHYGTMLGVGYYAALDFPHLPFQPIHEGRWFMQRSMIIHDWLKDRDYDQIHFQEWQANGFFAMQAKRTAQAYANTLLTICLHSSSEWIREGNRLFPEQGIDDTILDYCERYSVAHADLAISPSKYMFAWAREAGWNLPPNQRIIPYIIPVDPSAGRSIHKLDELCFFGRLETRKGLEVFIHALEILAQKHRLPFLTFLGKYGHTTEGGAQNYLTHNLGRLKAQYNIITDKSSADCIELLKKKRGALVVIPSLLDNLPYTVYECIANGIPLIASDVGGIPEMIIDSDHLFAPNAKALATRLEIIMTQGLSELPKSALPENSRIGWKAIRDYILPPLPRNSRGIIPADVTICIAHFNYGQYLPALLTSLSNQTLSGFSMVVVDDGSTDPRSIQIFEELTRKYEGTAWRFLRKTNGGIGQTRNYAASHATSDYILFMDADNLAEPHMVARFIDCMDHFRGDVLTCHMRGFKDEFGETPTIVYSYMPPGPCLEAGFQSNVFGDANCIIRKTAFVEIGGFNEDRRSSFEDWEILAKFALRGYKVDVIPEQLFLYRHTEQGFSRNTSLYLNHRRVLDAYKAAVPDWAGRVMLSAYSANMVMHRLGMNRPVSTPVATLPVGFEFRELGLRYLKRYPKTPWRYNGPKFVLACVWFVTNSRWPYIQKRLGVMI